MSDRGPKHHLSYAEGLGYGLVGAAAVTTFVPRAALLLIGVGGLLSVIAMSKNNSHMGSDDD